MTMSGPCPACGGVAMGSIRAWHRDGCPRKDAKPMTPEERLELARRAKWLKDEDDARNVDRCGEWPSDDEDLSDVDEMENW